MPADQHLDPQGREAASRAAEHAQSAAAAAGLAAAAAAEALGAVAHVAADRGRAALDGATEVLGHVARDSAERLPVPVVLEGVVEEAFQRGTEAWNALRGQPRPVRRWPWATGTAVAGALLGVAAAVAYQRLAWRDVPGAQDPDELQAVVDAPPVTAPAAQVDEDGEAVRP